MTNNYTNLRITIRMLEGKRYNILSANVFNNSKRVVILETEDTETFIAFTNGFLQSRNKRKSNV